MNYQRGLTLVELMLVLAILGILIVAVGPSFDNAQAQAQSDAAAHRIMASIAMARRESLRLNVPVSICPSTDGQQCSDRREHWSRGWLIYRQLDSGGSRALREESQILRYVADPARGLTANRDVFTLRTDGRRSTNGTFMFCDEAGKPERRAVVVNVTGRARSVEDLDHLPPNRC